MNQESSFIVGWGTLALINAGLAQGKNRSGFRWFLLSLLLGPIATFALVALAPKLPWTDTTQIARPNPELEKTEEKIPPG